MAKVYLIILNWNGYKDTCECLRSVLDISFNDLQVVVVDNASTNNSCDEIEYWAKQNGLETIRLSRELAENSEVTSYSKPGALDVGNSIFLIQTGENLGFAGGNNIGISFALRMQAEYVWILNNDTVVDPGCLEPLISVMEINSHIGIAGSRVMYYDRPNEVQTTGMRLGINYLTISHYDFGNVDANVILVQPVEVDCVAASSMLVRSKMVEEIGLMDEDYFMYHEDIDWQIRVRKHGWKVFYVPSSGILHKCGASSKKSSFVGAYYQSRNKFLLVSKNNGKFVALLMVPLTLALFRNIAIAFFKGDLTAASAIWQGGRDFFLGRIGYREFGNVRKPTIKQLKNLQ